MSAKEDDYILAGLTDAERAALAEPDDEDPNATQAELEERAAAEAAAATAAPTDTNKDDNAQAQPAAKKVDDPAGGAAAVDVPATAAAPAAAEPAKAAAHEPSPAPSAPLLVIEAPADAEAKLADLASKKEDLATKFDDGDITTKEFQIELDKLNKAEREIERAVDAASIAATMENQRQKNDWDRDCTGFMTSHPEYHGEANAEAFAHLNETIIAYAKMPRNAGLSGPDLLEKAHKAVMAERGTPVTAAAPAAAAKPAGAKAPTPPALPPDISRLPSASSNDPGEGKWASLDAMAVSNPAAYEVALSKLTEAERDSYLAA